MPRAEGWSRFVPYGGLIQAAASRYALDPGFLAATIAQETGLTFSPWVTYVTAKESSFSLAQWNARARGYDDLADWWRPEVGVDLSARALRDTADRVLRPGATPTGEHEWLLVRHAYAYGVAGLRNALGATPATAALQATKVGQSHIACIDAVLGHPLLHPKWRASRKPVKRDEWERWAGLRLVEWRLAGVLTRSTVDFRDRFAAVAPELRFGRREVEMNLREFMVWPTITERARVAMAKLAAIMWWYGPKAGGLLWTSDYRSWEHERAKKPDSDSQHAHRTALDTTWSAAQRETHAVPGLARLAAGWTLGPDIDELGGLGVYSAKRAAGMLHADARPRKAGQIAKWGHGYEPVLPF